jgi:hypothetical protein
MKVEETAEAMIGAVKQHAMEIAEIPADEREARYAIYRKAYLESALETGLPPKKAQEIADKMIEWTQMLAKVMKEGKGASGDNA